VRLIDYIAGVVNSNPVLFAFALSFASNAIPYMTVPYLIAIAIMAGNIKGIVLKTLIVVAAGVGAGIGKVVVYFMGRGVHRVLPESTRENLEVFSKLFEKSMFIAVLLFAALPLPDDLLYIPLGVAGYSIKLFTVAVIIGKIIITAMAAAFGTAVSSLVGEAGASSMIATIVILVVSIIITIMVIRIDWMKVAKAYAEKGFWEGTRILLIEAAESLKPKRRRPRREAYQSPG